MKAILKITTLIPFLVVASQAIATATVRCPSPELAQKIFALRDVTEGGITWGSMIGSKSPDLKHRKIDVKLNDLGWNHVTAVFQQSSPAYGATPVILCWVEEGDTGVNVTGSLPAGLYTSCQFNGKTSTNDHPNFDRDNPIATPFSTVCAPPANCELTCS